MKTHYEQQLDAILNGLHIDQAQCQITLKIDGYQTSYKPDTLQVTLAGLIYQHFYCAADTAAPTLAGLPTDNSFMDELSRNNHSVETFDTAWSVETVDQAGIPYVTKGNDRRMVYAGEFVYDSPKRGPAQAGDTVRLLMHRELRDLQSGFYYVFGQKPGEDSITLQTRLYFHSTPEGSLRLVSWVTQTLNTYRIPFQFKCLNHPDLYGRSDSAVLYLSKPYVNVVLDLLTEALPDLEPWLQPSIPLFTRLIAPGIGFAESPPNPSESFGTSRSGLIAQGIANAVAKQQSGETYNEAVQSLFDKLGLSLDQPYRNPQSTYPYTFPTHSTN
ncbi:hypothetical protein G8759_12180 [Spirosoma aureum]|uniref:Uncharacterized protein n=1 Tax=Spirosoma aureum TaxID=2692134 RepID=A0A6G9ALH3_9BACT|nr:T3SS effector HopA1 family protein [Spirosoma aureum]QIP13332.1 hypothetical protein G8759_12180 [Spirosoma aureum]